MKVYVIEKWHAKLFLSSMGIFMSAGIFITFLLLLLGVLPGNGDEWPIISFESFASVVLRFCFVGFGLLIAGVVFYSMWSELTNFPYEVCIYDSGTVEFRRIMSSVTMSATDIEVMQKSLIHSEDGDFRELRILHTRGWTLIRDSYWLDDFVAHLQSLNPALIVQGSWT